MSREVDKLPQGWAIAAGKDVFEFFRGVSYKKTEAEEVPSSDSIAILRAGNIQDGRILLDDLVYVPKTCVTEQQRIRKGDLIIAMSSGSASLVGKVAVVTDDMPSVSYGAFCGLLRPLTKEIQHWLSEFFQTRDYRNLISEAAAGVNINNLRSEYLYELSIPVPPESELLRLEPLIEALQERSRKAREALAEVGPLLDQFRQSILAAAFRGDLTADWRAANPNVEPASELLNRIRQERRQKWEQTELAKYEAKGKQPPKGWQTGYQEPESINGIGLPELPDSWCWTKAEEVCAYITKGTTPPKESMTQCNGEIRFLKVGNLTFSGALDFSKENAYIDFGTHNSGVYARSRVYPGDVLMNLVGPPLGKVSVIPAELEHSNVNQAIAIFRPLVGLNSSYLTIVLTTPSILDRIISRAKQTSGQRNLTLDLARGLPIPLAPLAEQVELATRLKSALTAVESLEAELANSENDLTQLDQSILVKAFRGELVPQDPNDEPASVLLERIRSNREVSVKRKNPQPRKATKNTTEKHGKH